MGVCGSKSSSSSPSPSPSPQKQSSQNKETLNSLKYATTADITYNFTEAKVLKVYDGDSLTIGAYYDGGFKRFNVRIYGIDCDEIKGGTVTTRKNAQHAKIYVETLVLDKIVKIEVLNNKIYNGKKLREKFGRLLAIITTPDNHNLGELLVGCGLARRYYGGKKETTALTPNDVIEKEDGVSSDSSE